MDDTSPESTPGGTLSRASAEGGPKPAGERSRLALAVRTLWLRSGYRPWALLLHRLNLHHTRTVHMPSDVRVVRCDWCGVSGRDWRGGVTGE